MSDKVTLTIDSHGVATVTLNRPNKHNAFDKQIITELTAAFTNIMADPKIRVMILAAEGSTFSAGADLNWMQQMAKYSYEENLQDAKALSKMLQTLNEIPVPTIARIQGPAFGGALGLISCCDIAIATTNVSFCFSEVKIGLIPAIISPYIILAMGIRNTRRYFITGETFSAQQANHLGLINEVVESLELDLTIASVVKTLLNNSPAATQAAKELVRELSQNTGQQLTNADTQMEICKRLADIRLSEEGQEGLSAFLEKRKPHWQNH